MNSEIYSSIIDIPEPRSRSAYQRAARYAVTHCREGFRCKYCHAYVHELPALSGVQNRNHCPYCLHSRHLDLSRPGDRLSACKGSMLPIGLTIKPGRNKYASSDNGELVLIHRCEDCGAFSLNRIAADDSPEGLFTVLQSSMFLDQPTLHQLANLEIRLLKHSDLEIVSSRLYGNIQN